MELYSIMVKEHNLHSANYPWAPSPDFHKYVLQTPSRVAPSACSILGSLVAEAPCGRSLPMSLVDSGGQLLCEVCIKGTFP